MPKLYLASQSPRRHELLCQIDLAHERLAVDVDESRRADEAPEDYVIRLARAKAEAGAIAVNRADTVVLGADTTVVVDGDILGKPVNRAAARNMLTRLAGRAHDVLTAVAVTDGARTQSALSRSRVVFRDIGADEIDAYLRAGEGDDKAGAYAIQGRAAIFVAQLDGSYSGVVGLPLCETAELLANYGLRAF
ncbi:MAG TPA: Maf family protein [Gammaproteobacteria bacterium]|nr:Maf family protein [Gammaproteobacteria bacterium]